MKHFDPSPPPPPSLSCPASVSPHCLKIGDCLDNMEVPKVAKVAHGRVEAETWGECEGECTRVDSPLAA